MQVWPPSLLWAAPSWLGAHDADVAAAIFVEGKSPPGRFPQFWGFPNSAFFSLFQPLVFSLNLTFSPQISAFFPQKCVFPPKMRFYSPKFHTDFPKIFIPLKSLFHSQKIPEFSFPKFHSPKNPFNSPKKFLQVPPK